MKMLLISNSGKPLYHWCKDIIANYLRGKKVVFISAATLYDANEYFKLARDTLAPLGVQFNHLLLENPVNFKNIDAFLVGGGNTYHLFSQLKKFKLVDKIKDRVLSGALYVGLSAGANISGPNILTTNDWNITGSADFEGINLVPFNINPHYGAPQDRIMTSAESRDERINEYFQFHNNPVVALEEETYLDIDDDKIKVDGKGKAKVFLKGISPKIYKSGDLIKF